MFSGLVEALGTIEKIEPMQPGSRLFVHEEAIAADAAIGDSIAVNGCCLTVVEVAPPLLAFEAGPETLARTNLGELAPGSRVNLERSLKLSDRLGGHLVTGHIDTTATLEQRIDQDPWATLWFRSPARWMRQMASKGSIAVDGVSLTLVDVERQRFSVALIPHTLNVTTLGLLAEGDTVNLETDLLAKYVERQLFPEKSEADAAEAPAPKVDN